MTSPFNPSARLQAVSEAIIKTLPKVGKRGMVRISPLGLEEIIHAIRTPKARSNEEELAQTEMIIFVTDHWINFEPLEKQKKVVNYLYDRLQK